MVLPTELLPGPVGSVSAVGFRKGDIVRCINARGAYGKTAYLDEGEVFEVAEDVNDLSHCVTLVGHEDQKWFEDRFELVSRAEAIDLEISEAQDEMYRFKTASDRYSGLRHLKLLAERHGYTLTKEGSQ